MLDLKKRLHHWLAEIANFAKLRLSKKNILSFFIRTAGIWILWDNQRAKKTGGHSKLERTPAWVTHDLIGTHQFLEDLKVVAELKNNIDKMRNTRLTFPKR